MNRTIKNGLIMLIKILFDTNFKRAEEKEKQLDSNVNSIKD